MFDLKKWRETSPIASNIAIVAGGILCVGSLANSAIDVYAKIDSMRAKPLIAMITDIDFQDRQYGRVGISFRNAGKDTKSVSDLMFRCSRPDDQDVMLIAQNQFIQRLPPEISGTIKAARNLTSMPLQIGPGQAVSATALIGNFRSEEQKTVCKSLTPAWTDSEGKLKAGDRMELPDSNVISFSSIVTNRP